MILAQLAHLAAGETAATVLPLADSRAASKLQSVGSAIQSADYGFYTRGNGRVLAPAQAAPAAPQVNAPTQRPQTLTANAPGNSTVSVTNAPGTPTAAACPPATTLLVNFMAGGGDDVMGGSVRNDRLWGSTAHGVMLGSPSRATAQCLTRCV